MRHAELLIGGTFLGGVCDQGTSKSVQHSPWDGAVVGTAAEGGVSEADFALDAAHRAFATWRHRPVRERQALLRRIAALVRERAEELVELAVLEIGKPITWARGEVARLALTFDLAADALTTPSGEVLPTSYDPRGDGFRIAVERFPIGVVFGIVPYNWPYNLAAHKLAPALAMGNTVILKASEKAALCTLALGRLIHEAGCPPGVVNVLNCPPKIAEGIAADSRVAMVSFTGSPAVGWHLKRLLAEKRVALELGGNAFVIVAEDADLGEVVAKVVPGAFGYAGQICISVQHVLAPAAMFAEVRDRLSEATRACPSGEPRDAVTVCGPMIDAAAADRVQEWIAEAETAGARRLAGGERSGNVITPTLLESVPETTRIGCEEVFGPVATLEPYGSLEDAFARVNRSLYGIQAGLFTHDLRLADRAYRELDLGGLVVGDVPTMRFDNMPYGGVKRSGFWREGVRSAMEEMSEVRTMLVRTSE